MKKIEIKYTEDNGVISAVMQKKDFPDMDEEVIIGKCIELLFEKVNFEPEQMRKVLQNATPESVRRITAYSDNI